MRMLPLPPIPLMPLIRRSRRSPRGLVVASLVTAVSLALHATPQAAASPWSVQPLAGQSGTASAGNVFPDDLVWWWPLDVGSAAGRLQSQEESGQGEKGFLSPTRDSNPRSSL